MLHPRIKFTLRALLVLAALLSTMIHASASSLKRATLLGVIPTQAGPDQPVVLRSLLPSSTATSLGLKQGDVITAINGAAIKDFAALIAIVRQLEAGQPIEVAVKRGQQKLNLRGKMQPRPYEVSKVAEVEYQSVSYKGNSLRSIVYKPKHLAKNQSAPAIFFIQGYTCDSIDYGMMPNVTTRQMMEQFVEAGYVTYRVEKPGVGDSQSEQDCSQIDFTTEAQAFTQALATLKQLPYVDADKVYIWGHSLGVLHSAVVAAEHEVAGVIGYGGVYKAWYDYLLDIYSEQAVKHFNASRTQAKQNTKRVQPFLDAWLNTNTPWQQVIKAPEVQEALTANLLPLDGDQIFHRHYSFFRDMNQVDFAKLWRELKAPVLMIHGSLDIQAIGSQWAFDIAEQSSHNKSKALVIPGAEHAFMRYSDQDAYMQARTNGSYQPADPKEKYDRRIAQETLLWLKQLN